MAVIQLYTFENSMNQWRKNEHFIVANDHVRFFKPNPCEQKCYFADIMHLSQRAVMEVRQGDMNIFLVSEPPECKIIDPVKTGFIEMSIWAQEGEDMNVNGDGGGEVDCLDVNAWMRALGIAMRLAVPRSPVLIFSSLITLANKHYLKHVAERFYRCVQIFWNTKFYTKTSSLISFAEVRFN